MERLKMLAIVGTVIMFAGCQKTSLNNHNNIDYSQLSGTWRAESSPWEIVITEEGGILSAIMALGEASVKPNAKTAIEMQDGSFSTFQGGDFTLAYNPQNRELSIEIKIKKIDVRYQEDRIEGNSEYIFTGVVSEDFKAWEPEFFEIFDYGPRFPQDTNDIMGIPMRFIKSTNQHGK